MCMYSLLGRLRLLFTVLFERAVELMALSALGPFAWADSVEGITTCI